MFGLMIKVLPTPQGVAISVRSQNTGVNDADVILIVEAWLDKVKARHKARITDGMNFGDEDPPQ